MLLCSWWFVWSHKTVWVSPLCCDKRFEIHTVWGKQPFVRWCCPCWVLRRKHLNRGSWENWNHKKWVKQHNMCVSLTDQRESTRLPHSQESAPLTPLHLLLLSCAPFILNLFFSYLSSVVQRSSLPVWNSLSCSNPSGLLQILFFNLLINTLSFFKYVELLKSYSNPTSHPPTRFSLSNYWHLMKKKLLKMIYQMITNHQELNLLIQYKIMNHKYMSHPEYLFKLLSSSPAVKSTVLLLHIFLPRLL